MSDQNLSEPEMDRTEQFQINHNYDVTRLQKLHALHSRQYKFMPKVRSQNLLVDDDDGGDDDVDDEEGSIREYFPGFDPLTELLLDSKKMYLEVTNPFQTIPQLASNSPNSLLSSQNDIKNDISDKNTISPESLTQSPSHSRQSSAHPTQSSSHSPTQDEYDRNFITLLENEKPLADILISTQNLVNTLSTITIYLDNAANEDELREFSESNGYKIINQIGIIILSHNQILQQIIDTHGIDTLYLREAVYNLTHQNRKLNQYPKEYSKIIPQLSSAVPNLNHFNPYSSTTSLMEQVGIFQKRFPSIHTIGAQPLSTTERTVTDHDDPVEGETDSITTTSNTTKLLPISQLSFQTIQRTMEIVAPDPLPQYQHPKALRIAEKIAFENSHGYGFSNCINYLGYLNYSIGDLRTLETGDEMEIWKPADFDSAEVINKFFSDLSTNSQSQSKQSVVPSDLVTYSLFPRTTALLANPHRDPRTNKIPLCDLPCSIFFLFTMYNSLMAQVWYIQIILLAILDRGEDCGNIFANGLGELFGTYFSLQNPPMGLYEQLISALSLFTRGDTQKLRTAAAIIPIPTVVENILKQFIKFPFCLEAPRLSLLQGPGAIGIASLCSTITEMLCIAKDDRNDPPIFTQEELEDLARTGKVALSCIIYTDWFETTIRDENEGKNFEIITIDQFSLDVDFDYYHNFFGGNVEQLYSEGSNGDSSRPQPFSRLGKNGKPLVVDVKNPKIATKVDSIPGEMGFFVVTPDIIQNHSYTCFGSDDDDNTESQSKQLQAIFTPDFVNLAISSLIKNDYSPHALIAGLTSLMLQSELHNEVTLITPLVHLAEQMMSNSQFNFQPLFSRIFTLFHHLLGRMGKNDLHFWGVSKNVDLIQSTLTQLYQIVSASCSGYIPEFILSPKNGVYKPQYQSPFLLSIHPPAFSPRSREVLDFLEGNNSQDEDDSDYDENETPFDDCTLLVDSMHNIIYRQLTDNLTGLPSILRDNTYSYNNHNPLLVPFITTHHGIANTISQLSTLIRPDRCQSKVIDTVVTLGLEFQILLASFARQLSDKIPIPSHCQTPGEIKSLLLEFHSGIPYQSENQGEPRIDMYQSTTDLTKLIPVHFSTIPNFNPKQSLFRSTYILYIEILIRAIQGVSFSSFHTHKWNDKWTSAHAISSNLPLCRAGTTVGYTNTIPTDPNDIMQLYNLPLGRKGLDPYLDHAKKLANLDFTNDRQSILSYPHTDPFLNQPIPLAQCRSIAQIQHCIESFIDLLNISASWEIVQNINFDLSDDKIGVYREDFLLPPEHDVSAYFFKTFSLRHGLNVDDFETETGLSNLDLNPVFENLQFYNLGHLVKAIPYHIWDYIYRQDYKKIGEGGGYVPDDPACPYRSYTGYITSTRRKRLNILKNKYPLKYQPRPTTLSEIVHNEGCGSLTQMNLLNNGLPKVDRDMDDTQSDPLDSFCGYTYYQHLVPATPKLPFTAQRYPIVYAEKEHQDELCQWYADNNSDNGHINGKSNNQSGLPEQCTSEKCSSPENNDNKNKNKDDMSQLPSMGYGLMLQTHNHLPFFYTTQTKDELDLVFSTYSKENLFDFGDNADDYSEYQNKLKSTPFPIVPSQPAEIVTVTSPTTTATTSQLQPPFHALSRSVGVHDTIGYRDSCIDMDMLSYNINQQLLCLGSTNNSTKWYQPEAAAVEDNSCGDNGDNNQTRENATSLSSTTVPINQCYIDQSTYSLLNEFTTLATKNSADTSHKPNHEDHQHNEWWGNPTRLNKIVGRMVNNDFINNLMTNPINLNPTDRIPLSGRVIRIDQEDREILERFYKAKDLVITTNGEDDDEDADDIEDDEDADDNDDNDDQLDESSQALTLAATTPINPSPQLKVDHLYQSTTYQLAPVSITLPTSVVLEIFTMSTLALGRKRNTGFHLSLFGQCPDPDRSYVLKHPPNDEDTSLDEYTWILPTSDEDDTDEEDY